MTRERAKELLPIIIGISEGKIIQFWNNNIWEDTPIPSLTHEAKRYRIKPEPQYRPFKDAQEFEPYRDRWVCRNGHAIRVNEYTDTYVWTNSVEGKTYQELFESYTFDDGTPVGKLIDEVQDGN